MLLYFSVRNSKLDRLVIFNNVASLLQNVKTCLAPLEPSQCYVTMGTELKNNNIKLQISVVIVTCAILSTIKKEQTPCCHKHVS